MNFVALPLRWLRNIIEIQEKKVYNFYVVFVFAVFVGFSRFFLEVMLSQPPILFVKTAAFAFVSFYLQCIFLYTLVLTLCIPGSDWKKHIYLVLIGVFLGIFPPIIDAVLLGLGHFSYQYLPDISQWNILIYQKRVAPPGETLILFITIFFTALVVFIKTGNLWRTGLAAVLSYLCVFFIAAGLPALVLFSTQFFRVENEVLNRATDVEKLFLFEGLNFLELMVVAQSLVVVFVYLFLNKHIVSNVLKRVNHVVPVLLTSLLGSSVYGPLDIYSIFFALVLFFVSIVVIFHNDYFDKLEDAVSGRQGYITKQDVDFFNIIVFLLLGLLISSGFLSAYLILLFFVCSFLYNYDFYRGKSYFPSNYKIEGVWGLTALLAGMFCYVTTQKGIGAEFINSNDVNVLNKVGSVLDMGNTIHNLFSWQYILFIFLVFGGWSIISVIKDYKDIDGDEAVGNQTAYVLLKKRGYNLMRFHKNYTRALSVLLFIPFLWLIKIDAHAVFYVLMAASIVVFYRVINWPSSSKAVESALMSISAYLLIFTLACHFSH